MARPIARGAERNRCRSTVGNLAEMDKGTPISAGKHGLRDGQWPAILTKTKNCTRR